MSTPAENIDAGAAGAAGIESVLPSLSPEDSWITSLAIDDPVDQSTAPLPDAANETAAIDAAPPVAEAKPIDPPAEAQPQGDATGDPAKVAAAPAPTEGDKPAAGTEPELTAQEKDLIESRPEAERPALKNRLRHTYFMDHFLNPDKPKEEVRQHLQERSPSQYAELETAVIASRLASPETFLSDLFQRSPETYAKVVEAAFQGDPAYWTKQVIGRDGVTPDAVKTALDFYDRHKDQIAADDEIQPLTLSPEDEAKVKEIAEYFPEEATRLRKTLEQAQRDTQEIAQLRERVGKEEKPDPNKAKQAELDQQVERDRQVSQLWDEGRNVVRDFVTKKAFDPAQGIGIHVTPEERTAAPLVAMLKDFKANVFLEGLYVEGKPLLEGFEKGLTDWGGERQEFKDIILHMDKYTQALERQNVLSLGEKALPFGSTYYDERLKHPIFAMIDQAIEALSQKAVTPPRVDPLIPSRLPSEPQRPASTGAHDDLFMIQDALARSR